MLQFKKDTISNTIEKHLEEITGFDFSPYQDMFMDMGNMTYIVHLETLIDDTRLFARVRYQNEKLEIEYTNSNVIEVSTYHKIYQITDKIDKCFNKTELIKLFH